MALINCPECTKQVSDAAPACPHCGFPLKSQPAVPAPAPVVEMIPPPPSLPTTHYQPAPAASPAPAPQMPHAVSQPYYAAAPPQQVPQQQPPLMAPPYAEPPSRPGSAMAILFAILMLLAVGGFGWAGYCFYEEQSIRGSYAYRSASSNYYGDRYDQISVNSTLQLLTPAQETAKRMKSEMIERAYDYYRDELRDLEDYLILSLIIAGSLAFLGSIFFYIWLYQSWQSIPHLEREVSPGKAVGFMFIPFFNFYWIFVALPGLSGNLAKSLGMRGLQTTAGKGLGIAACILSLLLGPIGLLLMILWVLIANSAKNQLLRSLPTAR